MTDNQPANTAFQWPSPDTPEELLRFFDKGSTILPNAEPANITALNKAAVLEFYRTLHHGYSNLAAELRKARARIAELNTDKKIAQTAFATAQEQITTLLENINNRSGGLVQTASRDALKQHLPPVYNGEPKLETIEDYLRKIEHWVRQGGGQGATVDDKRIDTAWRHLSPTVFEWFEKTWAPTVARTVTLGITPAIPPADFRYWGATWEQFVAAFKLHFAPEYAVSAVRTEFKQMKYDKKDVLAFNQRCLRLVRMLGGDTTIGRSNPLFDEYVGKLPTDVQRTITTAAAIQRKINPATPFTLGDAMGMAAEGLLPTALTVQGTATQQSAALTGNLQGDDGTVPMDLTVARMENMQCYRCRGYGHAARDCATPDTRDRTAKWEGSRQPMGRMGQRGGRPADAMRRGNFKQRGGYAGGAARRKINMVHEKREETENEEGGGQSPGHSADQEDDLESEETNIDDMGSGNEQW